MEELFNAKIAYLAYAFTIYMRCAIQQYLRRCFWSLLSKMSCSTKWQMCKCFIPRKTVWKALFTAIEFLHCFATKVINLHSLSCNNLTCLFENALNGSLLPFIFQLFCDLSSRHQIYTDTVWKNEKISENNLEIGQIIMWIYFE